MQERSLDVYSSERKLRTVPLSSKNKVSFKYAFLHAEMRNPSVNVKVTKHKYQAVF